MQKNKKSLGQDMEVHNSLKEVHGHVYKTKLNMYNKQIEETWSLKDLHY
jgi:hypothetical protein